MVWGSFYASGVGVLRRVIGNMDQHQYHTILVNAVLPEIKKLANQYPSNVIWNFQQDNDPKHTAKKNKKYLENKQKEGKIKFEVMAWASQSPDLNPIENIWTILKDALRDRPDRPSNLDQLFEFLKQEWQKIPKDYLVKLVKSLPNRIKEVIKNRGGWSHY
jgi:transposase